MRSGTPPDALAALSLRDAAAGIRRREFSAEALMVSYVARIRKHDARIHAWAWHDDERALKQAREADATLRERASAGPLHGIPIGVKDIIETRGIPTGMGSPIYADFVPASSATCIEQLERAGAFVSGKTVTTEFATERPGPTTNPWNVRCTPGGSSSGSAAAVAARFVPAALGTQTRGSVIRPAAYCGIVGFKPSFGLVSRHGVLEVSGTLDHVGVLTRDIDDAGYLVAAMADEDARDPATLLRRARPRGLDALADLAGPPHLAAVRSPSWGLAESAAQAQFIAACDMLRARGARIDDIELPPAFERGADATRTIQLAELARNFDALRSRDGDRMSPAFRALYDRGAAITSDAYREALEIRAELQDALASVLSGFDAIVTPPASGEAPEGLGSTGNAAFCSVWSLCGVPCVVFPTGVGPRALPLGLQVVGAYLDDVRTLVVAKWCARELPFDHAPEL